MRLTLAAAIAIVLTGCGERAGEAKAAASGPPAAPPVSVAAAIEKDILESDEFPGRVEAIEQVEVRARVSGYPQAVHFAPGGQVKKGDRLFTIDPRPFTAQVAAAEGQVASTARNSRSHGRSSRETSRCGRTAQPRSGSTTMP
jgi:multidrug efflux system membrane fusion protein